MTMGSASMGSFMNTHHIFLRFVAGQYVLRNIVKDYNDMIHLGCHARTKHYNKYTVFYERVDVREYMPQQRRNHGRSFYRRLDVSTFRTRRPCRITVSL